MGWTTPSSWGNPRQKVGVLNKYKLLSIIVSTSKYLRASDNIYISTVFRLLRGGCEGPPPHPGLAAALQPE